MSQKLKGAMEGCDEEAISYRRKRIGAPPLPLTAARVFARLSLPLAVVGWLGLVVLVIGVATVPPRFVKGHERLVEVGFLMTVGWLYGCAVGSIVTGWAALVRVKRVEQGVVAELAKPALFLGFFLLFVLLGLTTCLLGVRGFGQHS